MKCAKCVVICGNHPKISESVERESILCYRNIIRLRCFINDTINQNKDYSYDKMHAVVVFVCLPL